MAKWLTAIIPKELQADPVKLGLAVEDALDESAANVYAQFDQTHSTWKTVVKFEIKRKPWQREIATNNKIYRYVNFGTGRHVIVARRARVLAFAPGGSPKTQPNVLGSGGGSRGGAAVFRKQVIHPGTEARNFDVIIIKEWNGGRLQAAIQRHINEALGA